MLHALNRVVASAVMQRATLLVNHVLASEAVATERLARHAGRTLQLHLADWPQRLPAPPALRFLITPAGLMEWQPQPVDGAAELPSVDLDIRVDAANPARLVAQGALGRRPAVTVAGDAALATDLSWVADNLRWDIRDDLARVFGELPARELARSAKAMATGLRDAVQGLVQRAAR